MNSPFANIFLAMQSHIKTDAAFIKHIDQDFGQLKAPRPAVSWPCVLIDFEDFSFSALAENVQQATGIVVVRLAFPPYSSTSSATPAQYTEAALSYYDMEWQLHKLLQGWQPSNASGKLDRANTATQKRNDNYRVRELRYKLAFDDYSTRNTISYAPVSLTVAEEMVINAA
jgi:hypothetical protein